MEARPVRATLGTPCQLTAIVTILLGRWVDWAMLSQADRFLCLNKILCCMLRVRETMQSLRLDFRGEGVLFDT